MRISFRSIYRTEYRIEHKAWCGQRCANKNWVSQRWLSFPNSEGAAPWTPMVSSSPHMFGGHPVIQSSGVFSSWKSICRKNFVERRWILTGRWSRICVPSQYLLNMLPKPPGYISTSWGLWLGMNLDLCGIEASISVPSCWRNGFLGRALEPAQGLGLNKAFQRGSEVLEWSVYKFLIPVYTFEHLFSTTTHHRQACCVKCFPWPPAQTHQELIQIVLLEVFSVFHFSIHLYKRC